MFIRGARSPFIPCTLLLLAFLTGCTPPSIERLRDAGYAAYRAGDLEAARGHFTEALERRGSDPKAHYYLGRIALDTQDNPAVARRHLEIAYHLYDTRPKVQLVLEPTEIDAVPHPEPVVIADYLAEAIYRQNNPPALLAFLQQCITDRGLSADYLRQARYLMKLNDPDGARVAHIKAVKVRQPQDPQPYLALADFYEAIGNRAESIAAVRKAFHVAPRDSRVLSRVRAAGFDPARFTGLPPDDPETLRP